ncbi:hypothetical protein [Actinospica robiniae]|uniref:hypothetical protein n=1 Tax=Actinospica robiniae TaxID=304901 RepID=UPI0003F6B5EB|nr:hypothetical protein [Actinospica robiniae]
MTALTTFDLPLNVIRRAFATQLAAPRPLALDGALLGAGLPARVLPLHEIKSLLMSPQTPAAAKRALWGAVIARSKAGMSEWTTAALGLAYPGLATVFRRACKNGPGNWQDIQAELVTEFLVALGEIDVSDPQIHDVAGWLCARALSASWKARKAEETKAESLSSHSAAIGLFPAGHPDHVLEHAVALGVLTAQQADLIGRIYLEDEHHTALASRYGISVATLYRRRQEAVTALAAGIEDGLLRAV